MEGENTHLWYVIGSDPDGKLDIDFFAGPYSEDEARDEYAIRWPRYSLERIERITQADTYKIVLLDEEMIEYIQDVLRRERSKLNQFGLSYAQEVDFLFDVLRQLGEDEQREE